MEVNEVNQLFGYRHSSKYLLLCSEEKEVHTGLKQHNGEYIIYVRILMFGWTCEHDERLDSSEICWH